VEIADASASWLKDAAGLVMFGYCADNHLIGEILLDRNQLKNSSMLRFWRGEMQRLIIREWPTAIMQRR
jgi:hypothetical protein